MTTNNLTSLKIKYLTKSGRYSDGENLYLQITKKGSRSWIFRYKFGGRSREMGLGSARIISLKDARLQAFELKRQLYNGIDPIESRNLKKNKELASITFEECAKNYINSNKSGWRNKKHIAQWEATIQTYANPVIGTLSPTEINLGHILKILEPIWHTKNETASRLRGRLESILDWATVRGYRVGENPARWRGHLSTILPKPSKVQRTQHMKALPISDIPHFINKLRLINGVSPRALEFLILTATRTSEVIGAKWCEIDFNSRLWIISAERMKAKKEHRVPLSPSALAILNDIRKLDYSINGEFIFTNTHHGKPISNMAMLSLLKRMDYDVVVHGFRSTFRDWCSELTSFSHEVCESALAHTIGNKVEAAYRRGDLLLKRRKLMIEWDNYCSTLLNYTAEVYEIQKQVN